MIYMTNEIERRFGRKGLQSYFLMPGGIVTELQRYVRDELKKAWSTGEEVSSFWKATVQGTTTTMVATVREVVGRAKAAYIWRAAKRPSPFLREERDPSAWLRTLLMRRRKCSCGTWR